MTLETAVTCVWVLEAGEALLPPSKSFSPFS